MVSLAIQRSRPLGQSRLNWVHWGLRRFPLVMVLLVGGLTSCASTPQPLRLSTGSSTGYYYRLGLALESSAQETVKLELDVQQSKGSIENLQRLLAGDVDLALVQLDVAKESMKSGEVEAIAILAEEHVHLISRQPATEQSTQASLTSTSNRAPASSSTSRTSADYQDSSQSLKDLQGKSIAVGALGSGTRFTADEILSTVGLGTTGGEIQIDESGFSDALDRLSQGTTDAVFYVGRLGANGRLREATAQDETLTLMPISPSLINFLVTQNLGIYRAATIPKGSYGVRPSIPDREITTLTTPTVLVARPDTNARSIRLITWSIVATARRYAMFYPELQLGNPNMLLRRGLFYIHPSANEVYDKGDPRQAWIRYWENNSDLQAGIFLLVGTSGIGMLLQHWRKRRSQHLIDNTNHRIAEISQILKNDPQEALREIEELNQDNRLQFIAGNVPDEIYGQVQQRIQSFSDQCRSMIETQRRDQILETLLLLDDWQETLQADPEAALQKLSQIKQQYREMLLSNQVDIQAYMELVELTLISVMTLAPTQREQVDTASASVLVRTDTGV